ncbi:MAG: hypothetical protein ACM3Q4_01620 [Acidobacteriota bacterium]
MKTWMMVAVCCALALSVPVMAQQEEDENTDNAFEAPRSVKVGGAGGVITSLGLFKNEEINRTLRSIGMPELDKNQMVLVGGEGYGYIMFLPNLRIGGFGTGGRQKVSTLTSTPNVKKEVSYHVSYGGFLVDYVVPVAHRFDIAGGFTIGAGTIDIEMTRDDGGFRRWGDIWNEYGVNAPTTNISRSLSGTFVSFNPHINLEFSILAWMQFRVGVGYPILFSPTWQMDNRTDIDNVPTQLKPDGMTINAGLMFGFFN